MLGGTRGPMESCVLDLFGGSLVVNAGIIEANVFLGLNEQRNPHRRGGHVRCIFPMDGEPRENNLRLISPGLSKGSRTNHMSMRFYRTPKRETDPR
ncbi:hypothetical protein KM043_011144 [Ampulex compressa]|nr:hypothetical protein KM043_011144 [Ampulex compressa]